MWALWNDTLNRYVGDVCPTEAACKAQLKPDKAPKGEDESPWAGELRTYDGHKLKAVEV